jgi:hypothetical protein
MVKTYTVVVWVMTSSGLVGFHQRFGGTYCLNRQGRRIMQRLLDFQSQKLKDHKRIGIKWLPKAISIFARLRTKS